MKAIRRYHINNNTHMVEFPYSYVGEMQIKAFRKNNIEFKHRRINDVLQAFPSMVPCGVILKLT
jgi:hypothetical protein